MMRLPAANLTVFLALFFAQQSDLAAQELTDSTLKERFQRQIDLFKAAGASKLGATRGLVLTNPGPNAAATPVAIEAPGEAIAAPASPPAPQTPRIQSASDSNEVAQPPATAAKEPSSAASDETTTDPQTYWKLPPSDQINVRVNFAFDSAAIAMDQKPALRQLCRIMKEMDIKLVRVIGHTDAVGGAAYNQQLSMLRAKEVTRFFADECHIALERLEAVGVGEQFLLNSENPKADENRRVEFQAVS
ncbi:outer membrane protein OmpA-like peptidoglycan-associated protein [Sinorhizobium kostiense]|uniref:Outer membrane protein OmpA-like peptidoglycan-associated protein n=1 Tax=Sinorhizobium kostiense TaxID=76747 RepID=A0ABS4QW02_9HYPH|nr:OmpA family protein [Sinorhizobium kostiense]MBP2234817.1 outer membrane protein OmpA-like peptidoglycan-associated protein [Sinorhizobium kostiense]